MRTIKFRGKRIDNGKWIYGYLADVDKTPIGNIGVINSRPFSGVEESTLVTAETICQFTGIKDGNGTEIFEGDIIEVTLRHNNTIVSTYNAIVDQKEGGFGFKNKQGFCPFYGQIHENYKVIGNIHDNPELKKGGAQ